MTLQPALKECQICGHKFSPPKNVDDTRWASRLALTHCSEQCKEITREQRYRSEGEPGS